MKFNVNDINAPHPQPGEYVTSGKSAQTIPYASIFESGKSNNNSSSAISSDPVVSRAREMGRSPSAVPTNNSNPLHSKTNVEPELLD